MEKCPIDVYTELLLLPKFDNSGPSVTRDKEICHMIKSNVITTAWGGVPNGTLLMMFTCCPNLMFLASPWLRYIDFQTGHFADFVQFKVDVHFANFGQVIIDLICSLWTGHNYLTELLLCTGQLFYWVWVRHVAKNNVVKIREPHIGSGTSYFQWFNQRKSRTGVCSQ